MVVFNLTRDRDWRCNPRCGIADSVWDLTWPSLDGEPQDRWGHRSYIGFDLAVERHMVYGSLASSDVFPDKARVLSVADLDSRVGELELLF